MRRAFCLGLVMVLTACERSDPPVAPLAAQQATPARVAGRAAPVTPGQGMAAFPMLYQRPASEPPLPADPRPRIAAAIARGHFDAALALASTPELRTAALEAIRLKNEADSEERLASDQDRELAPGQEQ